MKLNLQDIRNMVLNRDIQPTAWYAIMEGASAIDGTVELDDAKWAEVQKKHKGFIVARRHGQLVQRLLPRPLERMATIISAMPEDSAEREQAQAMYEEFDYSLKHPKPVPGCSHCGGGSNREVTEKIRRWIAEHLERGGSSNGYSKPEERPVDSGSSTPAGNGVQEAGTPHGGHDNGDARGQAKDGSDEPLSQPV